MKQDLELTTSRLILMPVRLEDFDSYAAMMADPEAMRFLGGPKSRFQAMNTFRGIGGGWYFDGFSCFSLREKASGRWVGYAGVVRREGVSAPESVAGIVRDRWGHGYGDEAITAVFDWAFDQLGLAELISFSQPNHAASKGGTRKTQVGRISVYGGPVRLPTLVPGEEFQVDMYVFSREKWLALRSGA